MPLVMTVSTLFVKRILLSSILYFCFSLSLAAQTPAISNTGGAPQGSRPQDPFEQVRIIIEFEEPPLARLRQQTPGRLEKLSRLNALAAQLDNDLVRLHGAIQNRLQVQLPPVEIDQSFTKLFSGKSATVPRAMMGQIQRLAYVKKVHFDRKVTAHLSESVALVGANRVQAQLGVSGEGVVVGIIDSGIDYTHPALGGGYGPGFKVVGGYDFVNDDNDPMDDHRVLHGTHVAGIVAGNGDGLRGVAPDASLMAFKVLNANGESRESWIIAGIERAADPNNDGDFSDRVDIVNMSLGSSNGHADDPQSQAVDNAVDLGIIFCISAGNREEYLSVGSPGMARRAITVGASDKADLMADFSSKGPAFGSFGVKPEVVSPGVGIISAGDGGGTRSLSGTSMSAPHVTGICALLKNLHPDWTPDEIKAAIVTTAINLDEEPLVQGAGRVDAWAAAHTTTLVTPSQLSFGFNAGELSEWSRSDTLEIRNLGSVSQDYFVTLSGQGAGIQLQANPAVFALAEDETRQIIVNLTVQNDLVADMPYGSSLSYSGFATVTGTNDTLRMPWSFSKTMRLRLQSDEPAFYIVSTSHMLVNPESIREPDPMSQEIFALEKATYLIYASLLDAAYYPPKVILREGVIVQNSLTIEISGSEATNVITFAGVDTRGNLLSSLADDGAQYTTGLRVAAPQVGTWAFGFTTPMLFSDTVLVSDVSNVFKIFAAENYQSLGSDNQIVAIEYPALDGIDGDITLTNEPGDFVSRPIEILFPPSAVNPHIRPLRLWEFFEPTGDGGSLGHEIDVFPATDRHWRGSVAITPRREDGYGVTLAFGAITDTTRLLRQDFPYLDSPALHITDGRVAGYSSKQGSDVTYSPAAEVPLRLGLTPIHPDLSNQNIERTVIAIAPLFRGPLNEEREGDVLHTSFALYDGTDNLITSGRMYYDTNLLNTFRRSVAAGHYRLEFENNGFLAESDRPAKSVLSMRFDTRDMALGWPEMTSVQLLDADSQVVSRVAPGQSLNIRFSAAEFASYSDIRIIDEAATELWGKLHGSQDWQEIGLTIAGRDYAPGIQTGHRPVGTIYVADLSGLTLQDSTDLDLRIAIQDARGSRVEWVMTPAFVVGDAVTDVEDSPEYETDLPVEYALRQNYPNPFNPETTITYRLSQSGEVTLIVYDLLGHEVATLFRGLQMAGEHKRIWNGQNNAGLSVASGVYFYRLTTPGGHRTLKAVKLE